MTDAMTHTSVKRQSATTQFSMTGRMVTMSPGEDGLIGIPFPEHSSELLSRLNAQRRSGLLCDLTLTSRGARYPTHRSVMAAVSLYFRRLFGAEEGGEAGEGVGGSCSVCQLDCVSPDALDALLEFAYTATLTIRSSGMREVLEGAQLLGIQCVADACRHILGEAGQAGEEEVGPADGAPRASSRRKQDRRNVAKASSPVQQPWSSVQPEVHLLNRHTPESEPPSTPERKERPPAVGHNGSARHIQQGATLNGGAHRPTQDATLTRPPDEGPSEEDDFRGEGPVTAGHVPSQPQTGLGRADGGGVRKRKSQTPQQCPVCQKIIHGAGKLPRHMRTHTGEKPFQCSACGVRFTRNDKLKIHMRKHTGERPYPCPACPARFLHSYDLKNHLSLHSGDRPYECPLCHKAFAREDHLQRHRKGHSCLELRPRRQRRVAEPPPPQPSPSSSSAQLLFQRHTDGPGVALLGSEGIRYPGLIWRAAGGHRVPEGEERERDAPRARMVWAEEEEEEEEEDGEREES